MVAGHIMGQAVKQQSASQPTRTRGWSRRKSFLRELNVYKELGSIDCLRKLAGGPGETSTITNGGKIRAMDDDRLAQEILRRWRAEMEAGKFEDISTRWCDMKGGCVSSKGYPRPCTEDRLLACIKRWLQQPAEG